MALDIIKLIAMTVGGTYVAWRVLITTLAFATMDDRTELTFDEYCRMKRL